MLRTDDNTRSLLRFCLLSFLIFRGIILCCFAKTRGRLKNLKKTHTSLGALQLIGALKLIGNSEQVFRAIPHDVHGDEQSAESNHTLSTMTRKTLKEPKCFFFWGGVRFSREGRFETLTPAKCKKKKWLHVQVRLMRHVSVPSTFRQNGLCSHCP